LPRVTDGVDPCAITVTVFAFDIADDRIRHIWAVRNPGKLCHWTTGLPVVTSRAGHQRGPAPAA
jgi:hypothetical protein